MVFLDSIGHVSPKHANEERGSCDWLSRLRAGAFNMRLPTLSLSLRSKILHDFERQWRVMRIPTISMDGPYPLRAMTEKLGFLDLPNKIDSRLYEHALFDHD